MLEQFNRAKYYGLLVDAAARQLAEDPDDNLHDVVSANISGGHYGFDCGALALYTKPENLEEALLALTLKEIILTATVNQLTEVLRVAIEEDEPLDIFKLPMDFGLLIGTVTKLAVRDPLFALKAKITMAEIAQNFEPAGLATFITKHCYAAGDSDPGEEDCGRF